MKHPLILWLLLFCSVLAQDKRIPQHPYLTGSAIDKANDKLIVFDQSTDTTKYTTIADLVNVPSMFASVPDGSFAIADTSGLQTALDGKQATLVSGTNLKTVNGTSLLGSGNVAIAPTNSEVNTAIATNPATTRDALLLEQALEVNGLLAPRITTELMAMSLFTSDQKQVVVFGLGDSLSHRTPDAMRTLLANNVHISGYAFPDPTVVSGTVATPTTSMGGSFDATIIDHGKFWNMSSGAVMNIGASPLGTATKFPSNAIQVWCSKQSGGGALGVEYSENNGSTWSSTGWSINTDGTAKTMAKQEFRVGRWENYQGTGEVYTVYNPATDQVTVSGATGSFTSYNGTFNRDGSDVNERAAFAVTGSVKVHWSTAFGRWQVGDPSAANPDYYVNSTAEFPPTCATQRDTTGVRSRLWRVTASGGSVHYLGAKVWDHLSSGVIMAHAGNGGLALTNSNQGAAAIRNGIGRDLGPTLLLPTIVTNGAETITQVQIETFVDNWLAAIPVCDMVFFGNFAWPEGRDALNATIKTVLSTRPTTAFYDPISVARGYGYAAAQGWNDPDAIHYDDTFWNVLASDIYRRVFSAASRSLVFSGIAASPNTFRLGSHPAKNAIARNYEIPFGQDNRGSVRLTSMGDSTGLQNYVEIFWNPHQSTSNTNQWGFDLRTEGFGSRTLQIDRNGAIALGPVGTVSASSKSTTVWAKSRSSGFSAIRAETNGTGATERSQEWSDSSAVTAYMLGNGIMTTKGLVLPGPYADDAAAAAATPAVPVGGIYRKTDGTVVWRQS